MSQTKIIRPYVSQPTNMQTLDGTLYKENLSRVPGAVTIIFPSLDAKGKVKTGLDDVENEELKTQLGQVISENIGGESDFYLQYREHGITIKDGDNVFDLNDPYQAVEYFLLLKAPQVAKSIDDFTNGIANPSRTYLYVFDPEKEETKKYTANKIKTDCVFALGGASEDVLRQVAVLTGVIIRMESSDQEIFNNLSEAIENPQNFVGGKFRDEFLRYINMGDAERKVEVLANGLIKNAVVTKVGKAIKEGNNKIADNEEDFKQMLLKDDELYLSFKERLNIKKSYNTLL